MTSFTGPRSRTSQPPTLLPLSVSGTSFPVENSATLSKRCVLFCVGGILTCRRRGCIGHHHHNSTPKQFNSPKFYFCPHPMEPRLCLCLQRIWKRSKGDFELFCKKIGWTTQDGEVERKKRWFGASEFTYDVKKAPEGHLPLTSALRGTSLIKQLLTHPVWENDDWKNEPSA